MVAHNPLNRSGRAVLPHPALTSGDEAEAAQGIGMMKARSGQPAVSKPHHPVPAQPAVLAASRQGALPEPDRLEPKPVKRGLVHGDPVVAVVSLDHRTQPPSHFRDGVVRAPLEFGLDLAQLGLQSFADRLPKHRIPPVAPLLCADVRSGRTMARTGLRMMPTFPSSP